MEIVHNLRQQLLCLLFAGDILKLDAGGGLDVDLGIALAHAEHHRTAVTAHALRHLLVEEVEYQHHEGNGENVADEDIHQRTGAVVDLCLEFCAGVVQTGDEIRIVQHAGAVDLFLILVGEGDLAGFDLNRTDLLVFRHADEGVVSYFLDTSVEQVGKYECL